MIHHLKNGGWGGGHLINAEKLNTFCAYTFLEIEGYEVGHLL